MADELHNASQAKIQVSMQPLCKRCSCDPCVCGGMSVRMTGDAGTIADLRQQLAAANAAREKAEGDAKRLLGEALDSDIRLAQVEKERDQAIADKTEMVARNCLLRNRPDLPIERIQGYDTIINQVNALRRERDELQKKANLPTHYYERWEAAARLNSILEARAEKAEGERDTLRQELLAQRERADKAEDDLEKRFGNEQDWLVDLCGMPVRDFEEWNRHDGYPIAWEPWYIAVNKVRSEIGSEAFELQDEIPTPEKSVQAILTPLSNALYDAGIKDQSVYSVTCKGMGKLAEAVAERDALRRERDAALAATKEVNNG